jgi:hypothetical protein
MISGRLRFRSLPAAEGYLLSVPVQLCFRTVTPFPLLPPVRNPILRIFFGPMPAPEV